MNCFGVLVVFAAAVAEMVSVADSEGSKAIQSQNSTNMEDARNSKLFAFIRIQPDTCTGNGNVLGSCMTSIACTNKGGMNIGSCARGLGTCCQIDVRCPTGSNSVTIRDNNTNIISPMATAAHTCRFEIEKPADVCQLRLDVESFTLAAPDINGDCTAAAMVIDSPTSSGFRLCGTQNQTRLYTAFGESNNRITVTFRAAEGNSYRVKVTQIKCVHQRVPNQCLLFHENESAIVRSFGWPSYMINHRYIICAARPSTGTQITWTQCPEETIFTHFVLSKYYYPNTYIPPAALPGMINGAMGSPSCSLGSYVDVVGDEKRCGNIFIKPAIVTGNTGPYMLEVNFKADIYTNLSPVMGYTFLPLPAGAGTDPTYPCTLSSTTTTGYSGCMVVPTAVTVAGHCHSCVKNAAEPIYPMSLRKGFCLQYVVSSF